MTDTTQSSADSSAQTGTRTAAGDRTEDGDSLVLVHVEPDARSAELLSVFTERFADEFAVWSVDGMEPALAAADAVDCIVTEQRLPDGSGIELVERLRRRGVETPVVFHTTCREDETGSRALDAGADAYFPKRPERGQYHRILDRLRELVDDARGSRTATTVSPDAPEPSVRSPSTEE